MKRKANEYDVEEEEPTEDTALFPEEEKPEKKKKRRKAKAPPKTGPPKKKIPRKTQKTKQTGTLFIPKVELAKPVFPTDTQLDIRTATLESGLLVFKLRSRKFPDRQLPLCTRGSQCCAYLLSTNIKAPCVSAYSEREIIDFHHNGVVPGYAALCVLCNRAEATRVVNARSFNSVSTTMRSPICYFNPFNVRDGYRGECKLPVFPPPSSAIHSRGTEINSVVRYNEADYVVRQMSNGEWAVDQTSLLYIPEHNRSIENPEQANVQYFDYRVVEKKTLGRPQSVGALMAILRRGFDDTVLPEPYTSDFVLFYRGHYDLVTSHESILECVPEELHDNDIILALAQRIYEYQRIVQDEFVVRDDMYQCNKINIARRLIDAHIVTMLYVIEHPECTILDLVDQKMCPEMLPPSLLPPHEDTLPDMSDMLHSVWVPNARTLHRKKGTAESDGDPVVPIDDMVRVLLTKSIPRRCYQRNYSQNMPEMNKSDPANCGLFMKKVLQAVLLGNFYRLPGMETCPIISIPQRVAIITMSDNVFEGMLDDEDKFPCMLTSIRWYISALHRSPVWQETVQTFYNIYEMRETSIRNAVGLYRNVHMDEALKIVPLESCYDKENNLYSAIVCKSKIHTHAKKRKKKECVPERILNISRSSPDCIFTARGDRATTISFKERMIYLMNGIVFTTKTKREITKEGIVTDNTPFADKVLNSFNVTGVVDAEKEGALESFLHKAIAVEDAGYVQTRRVKKWCARSSRIPRSIMDLDENNITVPALCAIGIDKDDAEVIVDIIETCQPVVEVLELRRKVGCLSLAGVSFMQMLFRMLYYRSLVVFVDLPLEFHPEMDVGENRNVFLCRKDGLLGNWPAGYETLRRSVVENTSTSKKKKKEEDDIGSATNLDSLSRGNTLRISGVLVKERGAKKKKKQKLQGRMFVDFSILTDGPEDDGCHVRCLQCECSEMERVDLMGRILYTRIDVQDICATACALCSDCGILTKLSDANCIGIFPVCNACAIQRRIKDLTPPYTCFMGHEIVQASDMRESVVFTARHEDRLLGYRACKQHSGRLKELPCIEDIDSHRMLVYGNVWDGGHANMYCE